MKEKILQEIRSLVQSEEKILLAISGGPDSMALLHCMRAVQEELSLTLLMAHVNHGLRPSAKDEAAFVKGLADSYGLPFYLLEEDVHARARKEKISVETAGRKVRYAFFNKIMAETGSRLATGHHRDDQVETILMHLLRGTGLTGLAGMEADGGILRPLLSASKEEIIALVEKEGIPWVLDESNLETEYFRNRLRHEVLPVLRGIRPGADEALLTLAENARDAKEIVEDAVDAFLSRGKISPEEVLLPTEAFRMEKASMQRAILRGTMLLLKGNVTDMTRAQTEEMRKVWHGRSGGGMDLLDIHFTVTQEGLLARRKTTPSDYCISVPEEGEISVPGGILRVYDTVAAAEDLQQDHRVFLPRNCTKALTWRCRKEGDRFRPFGSGGEKSLAKAMKDLKIRHDLRDQWPLLCSGEQVYWIAGRQKSEETRLSVGSVAKAYEYIPREDKDARI